MPLGRPCSHDCGELHGRSDKFSDSGVLAQPPNPMPTSTSNRQNAQHEGDQETLTMRDEPE